MLNKPLITKNLPLFTYVIKFVSLIWKQKHSTLEEKIGTDVVSIRGRHILISVLIFLCKYRKFIFIDVY